MLHCCELLCAKATNRDWLQRLPAVMLGLVRADRVFGILRENNPELTGEKRRTIMKPPQVRGSCTLDNRTCEAIHSGINNRDKFGASSQTPA